VAPQLSAAQEEHYDIVSMRLGLERVAAHRADRGGVGVRALLWAREHARVEDDGVRYELELARAWG